MNNEKRGQVLALSLLLFTFSLLPCYSQETGVIRELSGTVELKVSASSPFVAAKAGDQVMKDTVVSTGFKSNALLEVGSTLIAVRPLTRLTLTEIRSSAGNETLNVNLQAGRLKIDVTPPVGTKASVSISSPTATASVRGTSFEFDTMNLYVHEGNVSFAGNAGQRVSITTGNSAVVSETGKVTNPVTTGTSAYRPQAPSGTEPSTAPVIITAAGGNPYPNPEPPPGTPDSPSGPDSPSTPNSPSGPSNPTNNDPDVPGIDVTW